MAAHYMQQHILAYIHIDLFLEIKSEYNDDTQLKVRLDWMRDDKVYYMMNVS